MGKDGERFMKNWQILEFGFELGFGVCIILPLREDYEMESYQAFW